MADHASHAHGPTVTPGGLEQHGAAAHAGGHGPGGSHAHGEHESHGGLAIYIYVFIALCVLTSASVFTYSEAWPWRDEPHVGWAFMMAVSCTKAMLVILFFMHVKYEANWKYVLTIPAALMSVFLMLMLVPDIGMRVHGAFHWPAGYSPERFLRAADPHDERELERGEQSLDAHAPAH